MITLQEYWGIWAEVCLYLFWAVSCSYLLCSGPFLNQCSYWFQSTQTCRPRSCWEASEPRMKMKGMQFIFIPFMFVLRTLIYCYPLPSLVNFYAFRAQSLSGPCHNKTPLLSFSKCRQWSPCQKQDFLPTFSIGRNIFKSDLQF